MPRDLLWGKYKLGPERKRRHEDKGERKKIQKRQRITSLTTFPIININSREEHFSFQRETLKAFNPALLEWGQRDFRKKSDFEFQKKVFMVTAAESRGTDF